MREEVEIRNFYGQQREDEWISANLELPEKGFYVDIGCGHPKTTSNTAFLRERGWKGLAIDGNNDWRNHWPEDSDFECSVISSHPSVSFFENPDEPYCSRIGASGGRERVAETIEECLSRHGIGLIDFFSLDIEGQEFDLLCSLDFNLHRPAIMVIEYNTAGLGKDLRIPLYMIELQKYRLRHKNSANMIFTRE